MRRIVIVAFDGYQPLDVVGPFDVFAGASDARCNARGQRRAYQLIVASGDGQSLRADNGLGLIPDATLERLIGPGAPPIDTLIVAGGAGARRAATDARALRTVRRAAGRARRVASVCTGSFVLAAAGLLDGRRATTHWAYCQRLAAEYPRVRIEADPIYVRDGRFWTSAGVTAGIDLALAMVEEDLGSAIATEVARGLVVFIRRAGGQSQFSAQLSVQAATSGPIRDLQSWIVDHPGAALDVPSLARRAAMSLRNFSRVFRAQVGLGPAAYVERVRLDAARGLLESSALSIEQVAQRSGFGTPETLRRTLARRIGLTPREYRSRFGTNHAAGTPEEGRGHGPGNEGTLRAV